MSYAYLFSFSALFVLVSSRSIKPSRSWIQGWIPSHFTVSFFPLPCIFLSPFRHFFPTFFYMQLLHYHHTYHKMLDSLTVRFQFRNLSIVSVLHCDTCHGCFNGCTTWAHFLVLFSASHGDIGLAEHYLVVHQIPCQNARETQNPSIGSPSTAKHFRNLDLCVIFCLPLVCALLKDKWNAKSAFEQCLH